MFDTTTIDQLNKQFSQATPEEIISWCVRNYPKDTLLSTHFGPYEPVIIHLCTQQDPHIQVLWADHGYNTKQTYNLAHKLIEQLKLNIKIVSPHTTVGYRDIMYRGIPSISNQKEHDQFTQEVKLEPFFRGLSDLKPKIWITALRKEQTDFRNKLNVFELSRDGILKVSPLFYWTESKLEAYIKQHQLPNELNYFDPTKVESKRECGLHPNS